ncbi:bifunctional proline dehydrogenase/L-glutamate gamma-semialdehyde dehydrogenase PutA [Sphingorhabdus arenilitoris]|uniref:Bifunctional protein PutA n=1 Tax=Sphingorhabdus arenilitoris TaxID=1490041 RepID=A0ABV8RCT2_9SPHN
MNAQLESVSILPSTTAPISLEQLYLIDESTLAQTLASSVRDSIQAETEYNDVSARAAKWVGRVREQTNSISVIDAFLQEYGLSTVEGVILMRLSEALIRTPDFPTAQALLRDKLGAGSWADHSGSSAKALINGATMGLRLSSSWVEASGGAQASNLAARLGDRVLHSAVVRGMEIMAGHFVLGTSIENAAKRAGKTSAPALYSYDMLGEAACTQEDAERYFGAYKKAVQFLARSTTPYPSVTSAPGLSVKLSALHPRYALAQRDRCVPALVDKLLVLAAIAKKGGIGLTIDAEEADRLELSLDIFGALLEHPDLAGWDGLGIVVQAYQRRASGVIDWLAERVRACDRRIAVRLVKGAYWDMEIKRAQELGLISYPVFTRKDHTDISYLACAELLLQNSDVIYSQFATHNALSASSIIAMAAKHNVHIDQFELQRLHGMGQDLHRIIAADTGISSRVYAPVGSHKDLLPYLVRRLLENGANSSFVNQLMNPDITIEDIVRDPLIQAEIDGFSAHKAIGSPTDLFGGGRQAARGLDLTQKAVAAEVETAMMAARVNLPLAGTSSANDDGEKAQLIRNPADTDMIVGQVRESWVDDVSAAIAKAKASNWSEATTPQQRSDILMKAADLLEQDMHKFMALCVHEAGKTLPDAVGEVREAVDFCRYYALQAVTERQVSRKPLGVAACISPWNFPLAIFLGQVTAALACGNKVVAKPAEQTPLIAMEAVRVLQAAGVPDDALQIVIGGGDVGAALTQSSDIDAVCFTGSTPTAKRIAQSRVVAGRADTPFIAETGGINAMIVDSTALLEQAVRDVVASAFQSAGQRCSACRVVCVQDDIGDLFETMLAGAMAELRLGDPIALSTDIGPIIDGPAQSNIMAYIDAMRAECRVIGQTPGPEKSDGYFVPPIAFAIDDIAKLNREIFGPVLHVVRFKGHDFEATINSVNQLGYGLTMGLHSRIDRRVTDIAANAHVGNLYINRNQIGAMVGIQPFGGEGLSGTGPKAGGPHYLLRLSQHQDAAPACGGAEWVPSDNDNNKHSNADALSINSSQKAAIEKNIANAAAASRVWQLTDCQDLILDIARELDILTNENAALLAQFFPLYLPQILAGPTGEDNSLSLVPRGVLAACGCSDDIEKEVPDEIILMQMLCAIAAGSSVILFTDHVDRLKARLMTANSFAMLPKYLVQVTDQALIDHYVSAPINGMIAEGTMRENLANSLAIRDGIILPLLSLFDEPERFFHERTLTINTTAAGGNASLLSS